MSLVVRDRAKAEKAGMAPKRGQVKMMFGNVMGADAVFTINKQTIKVAAGAGPRARTARRSTCRRANTRSWSRSPGKPRRRRRATVAADETWGLLVGPGGVMPLQMY